MSHSKKTEKETWTTQKCGHVQAATTGSSPAQLIPQNRTEIVP